MQYQVSDHASNLKQKSSGNLSSPCHGVSPRIPFRTHKRQRLCFQQDSLDTGLKRFTARAASEVGQQYDGLFGKWTLEESDRREVLSYRACLSIATAALVFDSIIALLPADSGLKASLRSLVNPVAILGTGSLGAAYFLIHIYVTPLKRFLQGMYGIGTLAGLYLIAAHGGPVTDYVAQHRETVWLVGPLFASITGLGIKEGLCYGTPAAAGILLVTPTLCLGHLSALMPEEGTKGLLVAFNILAIVFAAGKYRQDIKGDIGDKSIFEVQALPKEEQEQKWAELEKRREPSQ